MLASTNRSGLGVPGVVIRLVSPLGVKFGCQDHFEELKIIYVCSDLGKQCAIRDSNPEPAD